MKIIDANNVPSAITIETDICVVGSGVGGMTVATQLVGAMFRRDVEPVGGSQYAVDADRPPPP